MATDVRNEFRPDYASHPGETVLETITALGMTQADLARRMGRNKVEVSRIIKGKARVTSEMALQLERALGTPASFWTALQCRFDEIAARAREGQRLAGHIDWLKHFPYREMAKRTWLGDAAEPVERLRCLLGFFGVASARQWNTVWKAAEVRFRMSAHYQPDRYALSAWLRQGERAGDALRCDDYDPDRFRAALREVRGLTVEDPGTFAPRMTELCGRAGVAVAFVPELAGIGASGATRWLSPTKALLQLCLRHKTDDHLWFTFFHEAGHILLHGKRSTFIDTQPWKYADQSEVEAEANQFAADFLIPPADYRLFPQGRYISKADVRYFADKVGVAPGIVVGRLQHDGRLQFSHCNDLKVRLKWAD
jgi:addiction module HigA family antidote